MDHFQDILRHLEQSTQDIGTEICVGNNQTIPLNPSLFANDILIRPRKVAFVDGGNAELIRAPNVSLQFIRIYASIFENNKRIKHEMKECYVAVVAKKKGDKILYETKTFDGDLNIAHEFDLNDKTLTTDNHILSPSVVAEAVRLFAELKLATKIIEDLREGDILIRDGDLASKITFDNEYFNALFSAAKKQGVSVCGVSKTSTLLTNSGNSAVAVLHRLNNNGPWYYIPSQQTNVKVGFVKLAAKSKYVFRIDLFNEKNVNELVGSLIENAQDPAFLGYPYGLIDADQRAHVSKDEATMLKLQFFTRFGEPLRQHRAALDAHDILNVLH